MSTRLPEHTAEVFTHEGVTFTLRQVETKTVERCDDLYDSGVLERTTRVETTAWVTFTLTGDQVYPHKRRKGSYKPLRATFRYEREGKIGEWKVAFVGSGMVSGHNVLKDGAMGAQVTLDEYDCAQLFNDVCEGVAWRWFSAAYA